MYRRQDNDIFGTASIQYAPRIVNDSVVDPHAAFRKRTDDNYSSYAQKVTTIPHVITARNIDSSRVNEQANFQDDYHRSRKGQDLQSSIFYEPTAQMRPQTATENS